jgi:hypothetical protein
LPLFLSFFSAVCQKKKKPRRWAQALETSAATVAGLLCSAVRLCIVKLQAAVMSTTFARLDLLS